MLTFVMQEIKDYAIRHHGVDSNDVGLHNPYQRARIVELDNIIPNIVVTQQKGCRSTKEGDEGGPCATAVTLPLCTLVFEVVDQSDTTMDKIGLILHPPQSTEPQSLRTLYDYVELCTPPSRSCILFLAINHSFSGVIKEVPTRLISLHPPMGALVHGVKILPPSTSRKSFDQAPSELLHIIFSQIEHDRSIYNWRGAMISFAQVCRMWSLALDHLWEDITLQKEGCILLDVMRLEHDGTPSSAWKENQEV